MSELDAVARMVVALLLGGLIGYEREAKGHAAGLRTNMLVCLGSALFMVAAELITARHAGLAQVPDPSRIASTIVTGVGFLGAGLIFQSQARVVNLTTATTIWVVAAVGMLVGAGFYVVATGAALVTVGVLALLVPVEGLIARRTPAGQRPAGAEAEAD